MEEVKETLEVKNALLPHEYWEWRCTMAELDTAKEKLLKTELEFKLLQREAEIHAVRQQLFLRTRMEAAKAEYQKCTAEYERFKGVLEKSLNQSLNNKIIDDVTFEIRDLPEETNK